MKLLDLMRAWLALGWLFLRELLVSAKEVVLTVLRPSRARRSGIVTVPLDVRGEFGVALLANMITLTPGTLSVDVSEDRKWLYVHAIDIESKEALIGDIAAGFETKILQVTR